MIKKKLCFIIAGFAAYCVLLIIISIKFKDSNTILKIDNTSSVDNMPVSLDLLSSEAYSAASIDGKVDADTPWKSNIELLGADYPEQGLFMMPGTTIAYPIEIPAEAKLKMETKIYDSLAEQGISDGIIFIIEVNQKGRSLKTYDPIVVTGDGQVKESELDMAEWQGKTLQIIIHCYDGGNDDAVGDWGIIRSLQMTGG